MAVLQPVLWPSDRPPIATRNANNNNDNAECSGKRCISSPEQHTNRIQGRRTPSTQQPTKMITFSFLISSFFPWFHGGLLDFGRLRRVVIFHSVEIVPAIVLALR
jgi:hypothetical protein